MMIETFLEASKMKAKKIYVDGKVYKKKRDNKKHINSTECVGNNLHIYTKWGANRYAVMSVIQLNTPGTKKKKVYNFEYITSEIKFAIEKAQLLYSQRFRIMEKHNDIYSYDVEIRRYTTEYKYEICTNWKKEGYRKKVNEDE